MSKVFISYSREDESFARELDTELQTANIDTWVDWRNIPEGFSWRDAIYKGIIESEVVIPILSNNYVESEMCRMEIYLARCYGKRIIPILYADNEKQVDFTKYTEVQGLDELQWLPFNTPTILGIEVPHEERFRRLIASLKSPKAYTGCDVYIAFARDMGAFATKIYDDLTAANVNTWIATRSTELGTRWQEAVWKSLMQAHVMIIVISPEAGNARFLRKEVLIARTRQIPLFPVVTLDRSADRDKVRELSAALDETYEMRLLSEINWFFSEPDYQAMIEKLLSNFRHDTNIKE